MKDSRINKALCELTNLKKDSRYLSYNDIDCCAEKHELDIAEFDKLSKLLVSMGFQIVDKVEKETESKNNPLPDIKSSWEKGQPKTYEIDIGVRVSHRKLGKGTIDSFNRTGSFNVVFENKVTKKFQLDSFEKGILHIFY